MKTMSNLFNSPNKTVWNIKNYSVYDELQRLRGLVEVIEGGDRTKGCLKLSLNNSAMSTIFGLVFMVIVTVTIYAFVNLYRALSKRFFQTD
ncbi:unnamed protein product [Orchesella dallaii]|uniref:Uncharacterized protein n=1 Tax=Orchesella dallaii TaxID=48710 RepID=A0ABP1R1H0_9HEXA